MSNYRVLCEKVIDYAKKHNMTKLQVVAESTDLSVEQIEEIADDCDCLMVNVGFLVEGQGIFEIESPSDYILEYMGEDATS